ncbi:hypothetical protein HPB52_009201 [Rhipicephalus sanguineus]|uniref:Nlr family card domain protein n=1 Tax=Rhipicephalus sanguineus TaxID=34632 RepID=A0A9D4PI71_RHISA|nr:hypothetical protein HPB52_009201 [Rhipicephalus sanguineus]
MPVEKSCFSGSKIEYRIPCTSTEGLLCVIFKDLRLWNEFFWPLGFELREFSPGQLSLAAVSGWNSCLKEKQRSDAATLLQHLLTHHRCIVSADLNVTILKGHDQLIRGALHRSPSLRKLKLNLLDLAANASLSFVATLPKLNELRELELRHVPFDRPTLQNFSKFLANTRSLTTLNMTYQDIKRQYAVILIQGLERNKTITTLSINASLQGPDSSKRASMFSNYLRLNQTLCTLNVTSRSYSELNDLRPTIGALFENNALSELNLIGFELDFHRHELITSMLIENGKLRSLNMIECFSILYTGHGHSIVEPMHSAFREESSLISIWLVVLAENNTLNEVTLDMLWMEPDDYGLFFKALACNTSLKKVNVPKFKNRDVAEICRSLQEAGVQERVCLGKHNVSEETAAVLPECKEVSCIALERCTCFHYEALHTTLRQLPRCSDVKSLCLSFAMEVMDDRLMSLMVQYLTKTTALRELRFRHPQAIKGFQFGEIESQMLADMLESNRTLCDLFLDTHNDPSTVSLTHKLSTTISGNYTLLRINLHLSELCGGELFTTEDVVRRNNSLATRAAHFITGARHRCCAVAAEQVQLL